MGDAVSLVAVTDDGRKLHGYTPLDDVLDAELHHGRLLGVRPVCAKCGLPQGNRVHTGADAYFTPAIGVKPARVLELLDSVAGSLAETPGYAKLRAAFAAAVADEAKR